jgi:hypothetical protein
MKHSIALMTMLLTLAACGGGSSGGSKKPTATPVSVPQTSNDARETDEPGIDGNAAAEFKMRKTRKTPLDIKENKMTNFEEYKKEINTWKVKFQARSSSSKGIDVSCKKVVVGPKNESIRETTFDANGIAELELMIAKDDALKINYSCKISDRGVELETYKVELKKSILVSGKQNMIALSLSDSSAIETLVLDSDAVLVTDGKNVNLTMNELVSNGGKIVTFDETPYAPRPNETGKSGGVINIATQKALGTLTFELRGLPAGIQTATQSNQFSTPPENPANNGRRNSQCKPNQGNGRQGPQGYPGHQGHKGLQGGDAGLLFFRSFGENTLKMTVKPIPGAGGVGGQGGAGGQGGPAGIGGSWSAQGAGGKCPDGPQGAPGIQGVPGETGPAGNIPKSSVNYEFESSFSDVDKEWSN